MSSDSNDNPTEIKIHNEFSSLGEIKVNHSVVASIVRMAALQVEGVAAIGGSFVEGLTEIFSKKDTDRGVRINEDEAGDYRIEIRVILFFGVSLAEVAVQIQENIKEQVTRMTLKIVRQVDVIIDGIKSRENEPKQISAFDQA